MSWRQKLISRIVRLETQREDHEKVHQLEQLALTVALQKADKRDDEHNAVRKQLEAERGIYVRMDYYDREHKDLAGQIAEIRLQFIEFQSGTKGRQGPIGDLVKWAAALLALIIMFLIGHFSWK
jgi:hypothetical protein